MITSFLSLALTLASGCAGSESTTKRGDQAVLDIDPSPRSCTPPEGVTLTPGKPDGQINWSGLRVDKNGTVQRAYVCGGDGIARAVRIGGLTLGSPAFTEPNVELLLATRSLVPVPIPDLGITVQCLELWPGGCDAAPVATPKPAATADLGESQLDEPAPDEAPVKVAPSTAKPARKSHGNSVPPAAPKPADTTTPATKPEPPDA